MHLNDLIASSVHVQIMKDTDDLGKFVGWNCVTLLAMLRNKLEHKLVLLMFYVQFTFWQKHCKFSALSSGHLKKEKMNGLLGARILPSYNG